jgi:uncharacterized protein
MLERDGYPAGVPCWVEAAQPDPEAAAKFYRGLFGWDLEDRMAPDAPGNYFVAQLRGRDVAAIASQQEGTPPTPAWNTYVWVDSADETAAKVKEAGGDVLVEPYDVPGAGRMAVFTDPEGAVFRVLQSTGHKGAQLVNEPGTWNFSEVNSRDPEGAKAFYGAVFGWEPASADLGDGGGTWTWFRVPGYGDYLAERDPELRDRLEEDSAPAGFEDAVAVLLPIGSDQGDTPPHWSITFAVDDADAIASNAAELGGKVLAPPFDAPYVRMTVISDPQGAVFTASKYVPPGG